MLETLFLLEILAIIILYLLIVRAVSQMRIPIVYPLLLMIIILFNLKLIRDRDEKIEDLNKILTDIESQYEEIEEEQEEIKGNERFFCIGTYYNACEEQCNEDFLRTASMDSIDTILLNRHELRWVALSRDLMEKFKFNDTIIIESENYRINGEWIVKDVMNMKWKRRVDFLVPFNDTLQIGKCNISIYKKN